MARGLRRCFGLSTAVVTALADNAVGRLVEKKERKGRNPSTVEDMMLAPRNVVTLKCSGKLRNGINCN